MGKGVVDMYTEEYKLTRETVARTERTSVHTFHLIHGDEVDGDLPSVGHLPTEKTTGRT